MEVEVKIPGNKQGNERQSVAVETQARRNDVYTVQKVDNVMEGDLVTFKVPPGGRLIISAPAESKEDLVYDRDQAASVRQSQQKNDEGKADAPAGTVNTPLTPMPAMTEQQKREQLAKDARAEEVKKAEALRDAEAKKIEERGKEQVKAVEQAKAQQQTMAGRPPGETPPKPGSPVGSPPSGNEGKDNK